MALNELARSTNITPFHSEAFFEVALNRWLSQRTAFEAPLQRLGGLLVSDHKDRWLSDFLLSGSSESGKSAMLEAIHANRSGEFDNAIRDANQAINSSDQSRNKAGVLRARLERIYALRRKSLGDDCERDATGLVLMASKSGYSWLQTQALLEQSSCSAMVGKFDSAWRAAVRARELAEFYDYRSLQLRAVAMEAALHTNEGRLEKAWDATERGLRLFISEAFPPERGFQFFSELEFAAEEAQQWHLAAILQKEAIFYIRSQGRVDFEATAHFHLAALAAALGNENQAKSEIATGQQLFQKLESAPSRDFLEAESRIALARFEARFGSAETAANHLRGLEEIISNTDNFTVRLSYEQAQADIQKRLGNLGEEARHLQSLVSIGDKGIASLQSPRDRWEWEQTVGQAHRRLLEIQVAGPHDPSKALLDWERYRSEVSSSQSGLALKQVTNKSSDQSVLERTKALHDSSAIVFAGFSEHWVAWIADDRGLREVRLPFQSNELESLVKVFYRLCSDPSSSVEKVKRTGLRLYELLLAPLDQKLRLRNTLYIESDGILGMVPWAALTTPGGTYLGTRFAIINVPGLAVSPVTHQAERANQFLVAYPGAVALAGELYPPLPGAAEEATRIANSQKNSVYVRNKQVTANHLASALPHASQFHFAGHAVTREFGGELLVQGPRGGELLSASTISSLDLSNLRLAVLAACSTGTTIEASRNPNGLVGAFIQAGTHRVVASNWAVDSQATSGLMTLFYSSLGLDNGRDSAENAWKAALLQSAQAQHPYYWAGYQVFGAINY